MHAFICREPVSIHMNDEGLTNMYKSFMFYIQCQLLLFMGLFKAQAGGWFQRIVLLNVFHIQLYLC